MRYFPSLRLLYLGGPLSILALIAQFVPWLLYPVIAVFWMGIILAVLDGVLLIKTGSSVTCSRTMAERFSNGDENEVALKLVNDLGLKLHVKLMDHVPAQFQMRDFVLQRWIRPGSVELMSYQLRPKERGAYEFGDIVLLVHTELGLLTRKINAPAATTVKVYPSFVGLDQIELKAISSRINQVGLKRTRRIGESIEFDTIKDYVIGDDPRHINWSSTAHTGKLMVNQFVDERSQDVYCIVDKSRIMKLPFQGLTLLDHSINASLALMTVVQKRDDNVGLMTFEQHTDTFLKASKGARQTYRLMEALYREKTSFGEPDHAELMIAVKRHINQRSLLLLFTNFESTSSLERQLPYLKSMANKHLLLVIFFRNTELDDLIAQNANATREIYEQIIARQMLMEKLAMKKMLNQAGILSLYTSPEHLNIAVINRYIEIKASREI